MSNNYDYQVSGWEDAEYDKRIQRQALISCLQSTYMVATVGDVPALIAALEDCMETGGDLAESGKELLMQTMGRVNEKMENFDSEQIVAFKDSVLGALAGDASGGGDGSGDGAPNSAAAICATAMKVSTKVNTKELVNVMNELQGIGMEGCEEVKEFLAPILDNTADFVSNDIAPLLEDVTNKCKDFNPPTEMMNKYLGTIVEAAPVVASQIADSLKSLQKFVNMSALMETLTKLAEAGVNAIDTEAALGFLQEARDSGEAVSEAIGEHLGNVASSLQKIDIDTSLVSDFVNSISSAIPEIAANISETLQALHQQVSTEDLINVLMAAKSKGAEISDDLLDACINAKEFSQGLQLDDDLTKELTKTSQMIAKTGKANSKKIGKALMVVAPASAAAAGLVTKSLKKVDFDKVKVVGEAIGNALQALPTEEALAFASKGLQALPTKEAMQLAGTVADKAGEALSNVDWGEVNDSYNASKDAIMAGGAVAGAACVKCFDTILLEVCRDFFQALSSLFANIKKGAMNSKAGSAIFGSVSNIVAFNVSFFADNAITIMIVAFAIFGIGSFFALICIMCKLKGMTDIDEIRDGNEVDTWAMKKKRMAKFFKAVEYSFTVILSLYLPISQLVLQVFACAPIMGEAEKALKLGAGELCEKSKAPAALLGLLITILFPAFCMYNVRKFKPVGSLEDPDKRYDENGDLVDYNMKMYSDDLLTPKQQACPFLFLYKDFEREWACWKIYVMIYKLALIVPLIFLTENAEAQGIACLVIHGLFTALSFKAQPFIKDSADIMDTSGRVTNVAVLAISFISILMSGFTNVGGLIVTLVNMVNSVVMFCVMFSSIPAVKTFLKKMTKTPTFYDCLDDKTGRAHKIIPFWNVTAEVRSRYWKRFWDGILMNEYPEEVYQRLQSLNLMAREKGVKRITESFQVLESYPHVVDLRKHLAENVEGVDVYYNGVSHDGNLDSATCFGKMYINPFPFHCVIVYDDCDDYTFIHETKQLESLAELNSRPEIIAKKEVRLQFRGLHNKIVKYEHSRWENHRVPDGTSTDSEGNTKQEYSNVDVEMFYHNGTMFVSQNKQANQFSAGFAPRMSYSDGHGEARLPRTGKMHQFKDMHCTLSGTDIGCTSDFTRNPVLDTIMNDPENQPKWQEGIPVFQEKVSVYRSETGEQRAFEENILNASFWYYIYHQHTITRDQVCGFFANSISNEDLKQLPQIHSGGMNFLFGRMNFIKESNKQALWLTFWADFNEQNKEVMGEDDMEYMNTANPNSICYRPLSREALDAELEDYPNIKAYIADHQFWQNKDAPTVLDLFYQRLKEDEAMVADAV